MDYPLGVQEFQPPSHCKGVLIPILMDYPLGGTVVEYEQPEW